MGERRLIWAVCLAAVLAVSGTVSTPAAEHVISSVTVRVSSSLEPGDTLPGIDVSSDSSSAGAGDIVVSVSASQYSIDSADWITSETKEMKVGDRPEMKVRLSAEGDYYFKGSYRSSNVKIRGGDFVSASREDSDTLVVKLRVNAIEGNFEPPEDAYWKDNARGTARWEAPEAGGTGKYQVELRRGSTKVYSVETTGKSYNFYPWMTTAGTYTFRVRTIAKTAKEGDYGKKSEWVESDEIYIAKEDVSDGSGRTDNGGNGIYASPVGNLNVGWRLLNDYWYYYYPDGSYQREGWLLVDGKWYLFQSDGKMLRGWQRKGSQTYYLDPSGAMVTGWVQNGGHWYYLNPAPGSGEGAMFQNQWAVIGDKTYFLNGEGIMVEGWYQVDGNWYFFYPGDGRKAVNTWIGNFYVDENGIWRR